MNPGYLRCGGLLLLSAVMGGCAASTSSQGTTREAAITPTTQPAARIQPSDMVRGTDIGLTRGAVEVDIPAGHKLMILYRIYHNQKLDEKIPSGCWVYFPPNGQGKYTVELSLFDPDALSAQVTDKIRLTLPPQSGKWLTVKDKHFSSLNSSALAPLEDEHNYKILDLQVGGAPTWHHADGSETPAIPPEWRVTATVRLEPLTPKEAKARKGAGWPKLVFYDAEHFPLDKRDEG